MGKGEVGRDSHRDEDQPPHELFHSPDTDRSWKLAMMQTVLVLILLLLLILF